MAVRLNEDRRLSETFKLPDCFDECHKVRLVHMKQVSYWLSMTAVAGSMLVNHELCMFEEFERIR
jgi:hypothetical protein